MTPLFLHFVFLTGLLVSPIWAKDDVVGGYNATVEEYPYVSFIVLGKAAGGLEACTGSVIGPRTVLTAAHCVQDTINGTVRIGSSFSRKGGRVIETTGYEEHPKYNRDTFHFDIALLFTAEDTTFEGENVTRGLLPTSNSSIQPGQAVQVAGWGRTNADQPGFSSQLQQTLEQVDDKQDCISRWAGNKPITKEQVCLTSRTFYQGSSLCKGDSGGPWTDPSKRYVIGVTSFGNTDCTSNDRPNIGISTFVTMDFITKHIR